MEEYVALKVLFRGSEQVKCLKESPLLFSLSLLIAGGSSACCDGHPLKWKGLWAI